MSMPPSGMPPIWRARSATTATAARLDERGGDAAAEFRGGVLVRGAVDLCARARRREAALPGHHLECRARAVDRHRRAGAGGARRRHADAGRLVLRLGHPHGRDVGGALQPDLLPQRVGVAARQRADRARAGALRPQGSGAAGLHRPVRCRVALGPAAVCRNCSAASRGAHTAPTMYPVACSPQAWASAAVFALVQASLGLKFDPDCARDPLRASDAARVSRASACAPAAARRRRGRCAAAPLAARSPRRSPGVAARFASSLCISSL